MGKSELIVDPKRYSVAENFGRAGKHLYQAWMPNNPLIPWTQSNERIVDSYNEKMNGGFQEYSLPMSVASAFGVTLRSVNLLERRRQIERDFDAIDAIKRQQISDLSYEFNHQSSSRRIMSAATYREELARIEGERIDNQRRKTEAIQ
jgi:hypothetical protein